MTDPISIYSRQGRNDPGPKGVSSDRKVDREVPATATGPTAGSDEVVLSETAQQAMRGEAFDRAKIEAIKEALRNGQYPLDSRRIAESFMSIERMID